MKRRPLIGLVVPDLGQGGGVSAVARFVKDAIVRSGSYEMRLVSLSTASNDPCSVRLFAPLTWIRGVSTAHGAWEMLPYSQVGVMLGEFEFQRYRPRAALTRVLADCDLIQVVSGSPAWANAVVGLGRPV